MFINLSLKVLIISCSGPDAAAAGRVQYRAPGPGGAHLQPPEQPAAVSGAGDEVVTWTPAHLET